MAIDAQHPGDVGRNFGLELLQRIGQLQHFGLAFGVQRRLALGEQHLCLEHEAVAHHQDVGALRQDLAQPAEEFRAIARQLLHALGKRRVQPLAEVGDLGLGRLVLGFGIGEQSVQCLQLPAHRGDLLVQQFDLGQRIGGDRLLLVERSLQPGDGDGRRITLGARAFEH